MSIAILKNQLPIYSPVGTTYTRARHINVTDKTNDLPAFVTRSTGWLRSYQSWSKKRNLDTQRKLVPVVFKTS